MRSIPLAFVALACAAVLVPAALAQPAITGLEGTLDRGQQISLYGNAFGTKAQAAPLRWDDFQNGTPGTEVPPRNYPPYTGVWDLNDPSPLQNWRPWYSNERQRYPGDVTALQHFHMNDQGYAESNRAIDVRNQPSRVWYVSFWAYQDDYNGTAIECTNVKIHGFFQGSLSGSGANHQCRWDEYWSGGGGNAGSNIYIGDCNGGQVARVGGYTNNLNQWIRIERMLDLGDPGVANGYYAGFLNLQPRAQFSNIVATPSSCADALVTVFRLGFYFRVHDTSAVLKHHISELYVDHSFARVEIGDAPTWAACTHREIQIPVAWSPSSITISGNPGTFAPGSQAYLFVVNENRQPSAGFPVVLGQPYTPGDDGPPGAPGTVTWSQ